MIHDPTGLNAELQAQIETIYALDDQEALDPALALAQIFVQRHSASAEGWLALARVAYKCCEADADGDPQAEFARAMARARSLAAAHPTLVVLQLQYDEWLHSEQQQPPAPENHIDRLRSMLAQHPQHYLGLHCMGYLHEVGLRDPAAALPWYLRAFERNPARNRALDALFRVLTALARPDDALALYHRSQAPGYGETPIAYNLGTRLHEARHYAQAIVLLDDANAKAPGFNHIQHNRGLCLEKLGRLEDAIAQWSEVLAREPDWDWPRHGRARCYEGLGHYESALRDTQILLRNNPRDDDAKLLESRVRYYQDDNEGALRLADEMQAAGQLQTPWRRMWRGLCLLENGRHSEARAALEGALTEDPALYDAHIGMAKSLLREEPVSPEAAQQALAHADTAHALDASASRPHQLRGQALMALARPAEAAAALEAFAKQHPDNEQARREWARALLQADHPLQAARALPLFEQLVQAPRSDHAAYYTFGIAECHRLLQHTEPAREWYARAAALYRIEGDKGYADYCDEAARSLDKPARRGFWARWRNRD